MTIAYRVISLLLKLLISSSLFIACSTVPPSEAYMPTKLRLESLPEKPEGYEPPLYYQVMERNYNLMGRYIIVNERANRKI